MTTPPSLTIAWWPIEKVRPYPHNPRCITDAAVQKVAASLKEFGWRQPIVVDADSVVIAGHTRLLAAQLLGWATVPVHVADNLTPEQVRAYRLADNRTHDEATWDERLLPQELAALTDQDLRAITGFDEAELAKYVGDLEFKPATEDEQGKLDELSDPPTVTCPKCGHVFAA